MKDERDWKRMALDALRGQWPMAILVGLVAAILGGVGSGLDLNVDLSNVQVNLRFAGQNLVSWGSGDPVVRTFFNGIVVYILLVVLALGILYFILGSIVGVGYARCNLNLLRGKKMTVGALFDARASWRAAAAARIMRGIYVLLWSLLLIVPGIMASFSYAMTEYILAEHPELTASEALERSKEMMYGHRWELFGLRISFIGWAILSALTMGIGELFLRPYYQAAKAAFYQTLTAPANTEPME